MEFLSVTVVVGYVLVAGVVRSGHAEAFNNFFGASITASAMAGGVSSAQHSAFPSPLHQERTAT